MVNMQEVERSIKGVYSNEKQREFTLDIYAHLAELSERAERFEARLMDLVDRLESIKVAPIESRLAELTARVEGLKVTPAVPAVPVDTKTLENIKGISDRLAVLESELVKSKPKEPKKKTPNAPFSE
jgi:uncharacterized small protein (DUF1192 family)